MEISGRKLKNMVREGVRVSFLRKKYGLSERKFRALLKHPYRKVGGPRATSDPPPDKEPSVLSRVKFRKAEALRQW